MISPLPCLAHRKDTTMATSFTLSSAALALGALLALGPAPSHAGVDVSIGLNIPLIGHGHGHRGWGPGHGRVYGHLPRGAVSVVIGGGRYWHHGGRYYQPWGSRWMLVAPPVVLAAPLVVEAARPAPVPAAETLPVPASKPDPVIYPRNGQSAEQTEADRQACNRWATTQPAAMADASVFHRAVEACMDGRGYTMK
ncbi:hypothetical protein IP87_12180 [beta proteobacterium AAP121]|nr:hypothetical protein IP80_09445 [beta proteobacterium AAP65]KPF97138.1 hypothetical protein IP87_12180 [beta proteobacterium AAP121]